MIKPSKTTELAWARLHRAQHAALSTVEKALKTGGFPPLTWYDVLLELERVGENGLRPFELEDALLLPQYGVSRLLERIEKAGYLSREQHTEDRRGQRLLITPEGQDLRQRMWPVYAKAIEDTVGQRLTSKEAHTLADLLGKLAD